MDTIDYIEWVFIIGVVAMYFALPAIVKSIFDFEKKKKAVNILGKIYLMLSIGLIVVDVCQFLLYDIVDNGYTVSRVGLIFMTVVMYYYTMFVKKKQWLNVDE